MDREEIRQQAEEYRQQFRGAGYHISSMDIKEAFEAGAEWMQKKMIDKACEWLYVYYPTLERSKSAEDAWDKFKKAMEE